MPIDDTQFDAILQKSGVIAPAVSGGSWYSQIKKAPVVIEQPNQDGVLPSQVQANKKTVKDFAIGTAQKYDEAGKAIISDVSQASDEYNSPNLSIKQLLAPTKAGVTTAGHFAGAVFAPIAQGLQQAVKAIANKAGDNEFLQHLAGSPTASDTLDFISKNGEKLNTLAQSHPEIAKYADSLMNIAGLLIGPEAEATIKEGVKTGTDAVVDTTKNAIETVKSKVTPVIEKVKGVTKSEPTFENTLSEAQKIKNPTSKYNPTEAQSLYKTGEVKVKGKGVMRKEVAAPTPNGEDEVLADLVQKGKISSKKLPSENIGAIKQEARVIDTDLDEIVNRPLLNKPYNGSTINKVFDNIAAKAKSDRVFISESSEAKAYQDVMDIAKEEIAQNPKNMAGLRKSIKAFNARMEKLLSDDIYASSETGGSSSVTQARIRAAKDTRTSLNDFLADNLESPTLKQDPTLYTEKGVAKTLPSKSQYETGKIEGGGVYKNQLQREAKLLNAADEIAYRSRGTLNKTDLKKFLDANPKVKRTVELLAGAYGINKAWDFLTN